MDSLFQLSRFSKNKVEEKEIEDDWDIIELVPELPICKLDKFVPEEIIPEKLIKIPSLVSLCEKVINTNNVNPVSQGHRSNPRQGVDVNSGVASDPFSQGENVNFNDYKIKQQNRNRVLKRYKRKRRNK